MRVKLYLTFVFLIFISFNISSYSGEEKYIKGNYDSLVEQLKDEEIYLLSYPFNLPDGWVFAKVYLDEENMYTRIFKFLDITNDDRYSIKNGDGYNAWCLDQNLSGEPDYIYLVRVFNIGQKLPDYGELDTPKGEVDIDEFFKEDYNGNPIPYQKILYIINNRDGYSKAEVQEAIWYYTMGDGNFEPETSRYIELVNAAEEYGEEYVPPCGSKFIIFALTKAAEETPDLKPLNLAQPFIIELPIPDWVCENQELLDEYLHDYN